MFNGEFVVMPPAEGEPQGFRFIVPVFINAIANAPATFGAYQPALRRHAVTTKQRQGLELLLNFVQRDERFECVEQIAYVFATAAHETARAFWPVQERMASAARQPQLAAIQRKYAPYTGRGYVQLTWRENYLAEGARLGVGDEFVRNPDRVMMPEISYEILAGGMMLGRFRKGHTLPRYVNAKSVDYLNARNVVNGGLDRAADIARLAQTFEGALKASLFTVEAQQ